MLRCSVRCIFRQTVGAIQVQDCQLEDGMFRHQLQASDPHLASLGFLFGSVTTDVYRVAETDPLVF